MLQLVPCPSHQTIQIIIEHNHFKNIISIEKETKIKITKIQTV